MTSSLVGSEMCIRDRLSTDRVICTSSLAQAVGQQDWHPDNHLDTICPVSYTHLTLPTICSV
eukprot:11737128-Prorocentrum_lima.AAC.1